ncbi:MAG: hypothetical protein IPJ06_00455 [Saprospiraceae bacterium]|nr:hypothetical protein [Saprospiraceae bacterium]
MGFMLLILPVGLMMASIPPSLLMIPFASGECDVMNFYEGVEADRGVKVLTSRDDLVDAELILIPTKIDAGNYKVEVTRKGSNLYKLEGTKLFIETRYCYEYATYEDAILKVESNYGYSKGKVIFE